MVSETYMFDKYPFVGATRAATFLGPACDGRLPGLLEQAPHGMDDLRSVAN